jgi:hypothetical protein
MALSGLCTYEDVIARMADVGLATASEDDAVAAEIIERKIAQANADIELDLIKRVQKIISPYAMDNFNNTPAQVVAKITPEAKVFLNQCAVIYTIRSIFEEGETRMRFKYQEAGDTVSKVLARWDRLAKEEFASICPLLTFDQDGNGTITLMERLLMNTFTSIRVTV